MDVILERIEERGAAEALAPEFDRRAAEAAAEFRDTPLPPGSFARFLESHHGARETCILLARGKASGERLGFCVTGPLIDPLVGERIPMIVLLFVEPQWRHRGLATRMVEAASQALAERGLHKLAARAGHNDDALISMGERWGFVRSWEIMLRE